LKTAYQSSIINKTDLIKKTFLKERLTKNRECLLFDIIGGATYMANDLIVNLDKLHTTEMGIDRIKRNLQISVEDVVKYCYDKILNDTAIIERKGKNWYIIVDNCKITVNAYSYTIITAHKIVK